MEQELHEMVEMAQICHFIQLFHEKLRLPFMTREQLESVFVNGKDLVQAWTTSFADLHVRLCKKNASMPMEKIISEWELFVTRRVTDKWRISFAYNPLRDVDYEELSVRERVLILHALCHWRLGDSEELMQFIEQQEVNWTGHKSTMNPEALGEDDDGRLYWSFGTNWLYREIKVTLPVEYSYTYEVQYACTKYIRLAREQTEVNPAIEKIKNGEQDSVRSVLDNIVRSIEETYYAEKMNSAKEAPDVKGTEATLNTEQVHNTEELENTKVEDTEVQHIDDMEVDSVDEHSDHTEQSSVDDVKSEVSDFVDVAVPQGRRISGRKRVATQMYKPAVDENDKHKNDATSDSDDGIIVCDGCKNSFPLDTLDPPLDGKPSEWQCLSCLVDDARGWPLRSARRSTRNTSVKNSDDKSSVQHDSLRRSSRAHVVSSHPKLGRVLNPVKPSILLANYDRLKKRRIAMETHRLDHFKESPSVHYANWHVAANTRERIDEIIVELKGGSNKQYALYENLKNLAFYLEGQAIVPPKPKVVVPEYMEFLPRRQSSRIALTNIRSIADSDLGRPTRSNTTPPLKDRAERAKLRTQVRATMVDESDDEMDHTVLSNTLIESLGEWVDWDTLQESENPTKTLCLALVDYILSDPRSMAFSKPVDPILDECPQYLFIIRHPMDLGTIRTRLFSNFYSSKTQLFLRDLHSIWTNCLQYNQQGTLIHEYGKQLQSITQTLLLDCQNHNMLIEKKIETFQPNPASHPASQHSSDSSSLLSYNSADSSDSSDST